MSFPYDPTQPPANTPPSQSRGPMQINFNSISTLIPVDHVGFNNPAGGQHNQVTLAGIRSPGSPAAFISILFENAGIANTNAPQLFWQNSQATFHLSPIRAWALSSSSGIIAGQTSNVTSVVRNTTGQYTVTMPPNVVNSLSYLVIPSTQPSPSSIIFVNYGIISATQFSLIFQGAPFGAFYDPPAFGFIVLQI